MPHLKRNASTGKFLAVWPDASGKQRAVCTGETIERLAWPKAAEIEAESRFWEDHQAGVWQRLADAAFSPRYLHAVFIGRSHIIFPRFRALLREAEVKLQPPARWRDRTQPKGPKHGASWKWRGKARNLDELLEHAHQGVTRAALRFRLTSGWKIEDALAKPLMSRAESGLIGANKVNGRERKP
jgi:hypothetical protein